MGADDDLAAFNRDDVNGRSPLAGSEEQTYSELDDYADAEPLLPGLRSHMSPMTGRGLDETPTKAAADGGYLGDGASGALPGGGSEEQIHSATDDGHAPSSQTPGTEASQGQLDDEQP